MCNQQVAGTIWFPCLVLGNSRCVFINGPVLGPLECAFFEGNASSPEMSMIPRSVHGEERALERVFKEYEAIQEAAALAMWFVPH